jgi:hypothetical protein
MKRKKTFSERTVILSKGVPRETWRVSTPGKTCHGSIDGMEFHYADGTRDQGVFIANPLFK